VRRALLLAVLVLAAGCGGDGGGSGGGEAGAFAVLDRIVLPTRPGGLAGGTGAVWATNPEAGELVKIDTATGTVADTYKVAQAATGVTAGGGSFAGIGTYGYVVVAKKSTGRTIASTEVTAAVTVVTQTVTVNWLAVTGATGYLVYRTPTPGTYGATTLIADIGSGATVTLKRGTGLTETRRRRSRSRAGSRTFRWPGSAPAETGRSREARVDRSRAGPQRPPARARLRGWPLAPR